MSKSIALTQTDLNKLLNHVTKTNHPKRNRLMVLFSFWCGLRVCEISNLKVHHVLNKDGSIKDTIHLNKNETKGKNNRVVLIPSKLFPEIENYLNLTDTHINRDDYLFQPQSNKPKFSVDSLTHRFKEFYTNSGIESGSSHSGRNTHL